MNESRRILAETIYGAIRDGSMVTDGKLPTEREMAAITGTSRTSLREALIVLETLGIIEVRGKQGVFVKDRNLGDLNRSLDLYATWPADLVPKVFQVRIMMESPAAGLAALSRTDGDLEKMNECTARLEQIFISDGPDAGREGAEWNDIFHRVVIAATHNEVLIRMHEGLSSIVAKAMESLNRNSLATPRPLWKERILGEHEQIVRAIRERDEAGAREAMRKHLEISAAKLEKLCQDRVSPFRRPV